jgi:hypothetical protein
LTLAKRFRERNSDRGERVTQGKERQREIETASFSCLKGSPILVFRARNDLCACSVFRDRLNAREQKRERYDTNTFSHHLPLGQDEFRFVSDAGRQARKATISTAAAKIIFTTAIAKIIFTTKNNYNALGVGIKQQTHTVDTHNRTHNRTHTTHVLHTQHCKLIT